MSNTNLRKEKSALLLPVVQALKDGLGEDLVSVVLFGSQARSEEDPESDWDLLVLARNLPEKSLSRHFRLKSLLPVPWRSRIAVLAKTPAEFETRLPALYLDIALDGLVLYDTDDYITQRMARLKESLGRLGLQRKRAGRDLTWSWQRPRQPLWSLEWEDIN